MQTECHISHQIAGSPHSTHVITLRGVSLDRIREHLGALAERAEPDPLDRFKRLARRPGRRVRVVALRPERSYVAPLTHVKAGEEFESLTELCEALGTRISNTASALTAARTRGGSTAVVRGVEFGYVDQLPRSVGTAEAAVGAPVAAPTPGMRGDLVARPVVDERKASPPLEPPAPVVPVSHAPAAPPPSDPAQPPRRVIRRVDPNGPSRVVDRSAPAVPAPAPTTVDESELPEPPTGGAS